MLPLLARGEGNHRLEMVALALVVALAGEWLGRWLFFVSVVPKNVAAAFTTAGRAA